MKSRIKSLFKNYPIIKKVYYNFINFGYKTRQRLPWERVCQSSGGGRLTNPGAKTKKSVLMVTCTGGHLTAIDMETLLAAALSLRGARVHALLCDRFLPACLMCEKSLRS